MTGSEHFIPYKTVSKKLLKKIANGLKRIDEYELNKFVIDEFKDYFGEDVSEEHNHYSIDFAPILKVSGSSVIVTFDEYPLLISEKIGGIARLYTNSDIGADFPIPVIYLMPNRYNDTLKHEKIHICQYLLDRAYPLSLEQKEIFLAKNLLDGFKYFLEKNGRSASVDFIINATCCKTWIEMEANFHTRKPKNLSTWMMKVYKSCRPIVTFESIIYFTEWSNEDMREAVARFDQFCTSMQNEVKWVSQIVKSSSYNSLHDFIFETHEAYEMDLMFGDIDEDDEDDEDDEFYEFLKNN